MLVLSDSGLGEPADNGGDARRCLCGGDNGGDNSGEAGGGEAGGGSDDAIETCGFKVLHGVPGWICVLGS